MHVDDDDEDDEKSVQTYSDVVVESGYGAEGEGEGEIWAEGETVMHGRLKRCIPFWREMGASSWIISILEVGYALPFVTDPPSGFLRNQKSCWKHVQFVDEAVKGLVDCGSAMKVNESELNCVSPLGVVEGARKLRLILDLRQVNECLAKFRFKLDDIRMAVKLFQKDDFVVTFDLKSGYHHVDMARDHWKYLGFSWGGEFYCFKSLPFGLSTAPYLFNKLVRVMVRYWRAQGIKCMMFFDDGSAGAGTVEETVRVAGVLTETLERAGWKINVEKSCLVPSQKPTILGFVLDLVHGRVSVAEARVLRFLEHLRVLHSKRRLNAKECARLAGFIISMSFAIGPVARLRTRALYDMILRRKSWFHRQEWSDEAYAEVSFWWYCFNEFHGRLVVGDPKITAVVDTWSDASDVAWGGFAVSCGETIARGNWPEEVLEAQKSSTWRELRATELVLQSVVQELAGKECRHRTDNQAAARILQVGSKVPELQEIACRIFRFCRQNCIRLVPEWVPREENVLADFLSKVVDTDDWKLSSEVFDEIDGLWGPHTVDCFASAESAQLPRFCSRWWNPGCLPVDAFTMCWEGENLWLCPPPPFTLLETLLAEFQ